MRRIAAPVAFTAAMVLSVVPISAQTISSPTLTIANPVGPVMSCPMTINFVATINVRWPTGPTYIPPDKPTLQYKWINSSGIDEPTQSANLYELVNFNQVLLSTVQIKNSWQVPAGTYWEQLQISFPVNLTSPQRVYAVTCPIPGALSLPSAFTGPIQSPQMRRPP